MRLGLCRMRVVLFAIDLPADSTCPQLHSNRNFVDTSAVMCR
jgi:hypothetical protein